MEEKLTAFVINLPESVDRCRRMDEHLANIEWLNPIHVSAVRGVSLSPKEKEVAYHDLGARKLIGRSLNDGEIGCALSHQRAYRKLLETNNPYALILEDDAEFLPSASHVLQSDTLLFWLSRKTPRLVLLSEVTCFVRRLKLNISDSTKLARVRYAWFSHAYMLNREAAKRLMEINSPVRFVTDHWNEIRRATSIDLRCVDPFCVKVHAMGFMSTIDSNRYQSAATFPSLLDRLSSIGRRKIRRLADVLIYSPVFGLDSHDSLPSEHSQS